MTHTDPRLLQELGNIYDQEGDKSAAFQHHYDSYKCFPGDIQVIEWLAGYYIESQFPEKAAKYFALASVIEPNEVKWHLMNASRIGVKIKYFRPSENLLPFIALFS